jgi:hypothetical protein
MWVLWIIIPIASTAGIVLGDLSLYKGEKLSIFSVSMTYCLGFIGLVVGMSLGEIFWEEFFPTSPGEAFLILWEISLLGLIIPPLIGYNVVTYLRRKKHLVCE